MSSTFYERFFSESMAERQRIAEAAGLSLAYIHKHTYVQQREPKFHFHNAVGLDRASNGKLCLLDMTEGEIDWAYVFHRLKELQRSGRFGKSAAKPLPTATFEGFWKLYPRKVNKQGALKSWHAEGCDRVANLVLADLTRRLADESWTKEGGKFIPHPTTYLNQRRWEEEISVAQQSTAGAFAGAL